MDCCCAGSEGTQNGGEELHFPVSPVLPCRDVMFHHPRTRACELLAQLPSSMALDSGIHAQTLLSNLPRWLNFCNKSDSNVHEEIAGTKALIPVPGGLVELFATQQVPEDQEVVDFVTAQCSFLGDQGSMVDTTMESGFPVMSTDAMSEHQSIPFLAHEDNIQKDHMINVQPPTATATSLDNLSLPCDISMDRIRLSNSPLNFLQHFSYTEETKTKNDFFFEGVDNGNLQDMEALQKSMMANTQNMHMKLAESLTNNEQQGNDKESVKHENGQSDSHSDCNDQLDDEDDAKYRRKNGKGPQSKNLVAERKRRRKLNDRLYALRALVPKISKLDRASILGDAIEYVKELQKQEKELHEELEEQSDEDGAKNGNDNNNIPPEVLNSFHVEPTGHASVSKQNQDPEITHDKGHQMEPQVEVAQLYGNKFFVKVFCERMPGGFVRLMEAMDSLGLEVTNANVTSNRGLVSNIFQVEKKGTEMVQADYVRDSLLEITRNPQRGWPEMVKASDSCNGLDYHHLQHPLQNGHMNSNHHHFHQLHS